jgi:16S rRNA G527 N7-methylase RsmG
LARPDVTLTLVEPMARRVEFLQEAVADLAAAQPDGPPAGWRVIRGRAEDRGVVTAVGAVDVVTARAVAPLPRLVAWCRGLMRPGAQLVARTRGRRYAERACAGCRCIARSGCHYRSGDDTRGTVTAEDRGRFGAPSADARRRLFHVEQHQ